MRCLARLLKIACREVRAFSHRPLLLFCMMLTPPLCIALFTTLMQGGLPTKMPCALVDEDDTQVTHNIVRVLDAMEETDIALRFHTMDDALRAMRRGRVFAIFHIPAGTTAQAIAARQPRIDFYTNEAYLLPGTMLMKDLRMTGELCGLALTRENLYAHGMTERQALAIIQPIRIEAHPVGNPHLDYSVYLSNMVVPGIFILLIMLTTAYAIGMEWKRGTQAELYDLSGRSAAVALTGKLMPQTLAYSLMLTAFYAYIYRVLLFPCHCGMTRMLALGVLTTLAAQGLGVFFSGVMAGQMRVVMCVCSLWGILSFSLAGFTYPVTDMAPMLEKLAILFPLRHYYLIYVNQALDGFALRHVLSSVAALAVFAALPMAVLRKFRHAFLHLQYKP